MEKHSSSPQSTEAGSPPDQSASSHHQQANQHSQSKKHPTLPKLHGRIELIIGPMFAGKSTELLRRMKRHEIAGSKCLRVKFADDNRYAEDAIATHDR